MILGYHDLSSNSNGNSVRFFRARNNYFSQKSQILLENFITIYVLVRNALIPGQLFNLMLWRYIILCPRRLSLFSYIWCWGKKISKVSKTEKKYCKKPYLDGFSDVFYNFLYMYWFSWFLPPSHSGKSRENPPLCIIR